MFNRPAALSARRLNISLYLLSLLLLPIAIRSQSFTSPEPHAYVQWAKSIGIDSANVTIAYSPMAGYFAKAAQPIRKGEIFL